MGMLAEGFFLFGGLAQSLQAGCHQAVAALLALRLRGLQLIAEAHQLIHPGDNAVLLGEGGEGDKKLCHIGQAEAILNTPLRFVELSLGEL
ncbi:MAG: hypothetical protein ER33_08925 [Cyanobium sp. CACIAM 14]|nr:MAG: hypothetical protein ER33_08925 [Cyanobium sp. CACIAM 14]